MCLHAQTSYIYIYICTSTFKGVTNKGPPARTPLEGPGIHVSIQSKKKAKTRFNPVGAGSKGRTWTGFRLPQRFHCDTGREALEFCHELQASPRVDGLHLGQPPSYGW